MELNYDWKSFQDVFHPHRRAGNSQSKGAGEPIFSVTTGNRVNTLFSQGEDLSEWIGKSLEEVKANFANRNVLSFDSKDVCKWLNEGSAAQPPMPLSHFYDQIEFLKSRAFPGYGISHLNPKKTKKKPEPSASGVTDMIGARHFLLEAVQGWWGKILPSSYALFLRVDDADYILVIRRGKLETFHRPNMEALGPDKIKTPSEVVKYLSDKYVLPVQGIFVGGEQWKKWSETPDPWREIAAALHGDSMQLVPFRWTLATLIATKAFVGV